MRNTDAVPSHTQTEIVLLWKSFSLFLPLQLRHSPSLCFLLCGCDMLDLIICSERGYSAVHQPRSRPGRQQTHALLKCLWAKAQNLPPSSSVTENDLWPFQHRRAYRNEAHYMWPDYHRVINNKVAPLSSITDTFYSLQLFHNKSTPAI